MTKLRLLKRRDGSPIAVTVETVHNDVVHRLRENVRNEPGVPERLAVLNARADLTLKRVALQEGASPTVEQFAAHWFTERYEIGALGRRRARPRTVAEVRNHLRVIVPILGKRKMDEVTAPMLHEVMASKSHLKPTSKNRLLTVLMSMFNDAERAGMGSWYLEHNPTVRMQMFDESRGERPALHLDEMLGVLHAAAELRLKSLPLLSLMMLCGLRPGEALHMTRDRVDLHERYRPCVGALLFAPHQRKEARGLAVPIPAQALLFLEPMVPFGRLCEIGRPRLSEELRVALRHAGISCADRNLTPHTLRHSWARAARALGVDVRTISQILGHASITTTERYLGVDPGTQRAMMANVAAGLAVATGVPAVRALQ